MEPRLLGTNSCCYICITIIVQRVFKEAPVPLHYLHMYELKYIVYSKQLVLYCYQPRTYNNRNKLHSFWLLNIRIKSKNMVCSLICLHIHSMFLLASFLTTQFVHKYKLAKTLLIHTRYTKFTGILHFLKFLYHFKDHTNLYSYVQLMYFYTQLL